ncbi:hypothetical protein, partial [uncultured Sphingomonas sp.]|uniref:hypothetical protein n=1 Tax=uncultured Sphingomonas sp. TaxID=158754 RepID=UPI0035CBB6EF
AAGAWGKIQLHHSLLNSSPNARAARGMLPRGLRLDGLAGALDRGSPISVPSASCSSASGSASVSVYLGAAGEDSHSWIDVGSERQPVVPVPFTIKQVYASLQSSRKLL